jgi:predicted amidophosphoribosyltransferase
MNIKDVMDRVLYALSVPKCVCCGERLDYGQNAFCLKCSIEFDEFCTRNCSKCSRILNECNCSMDYLEGHFVKRIIKCYRYVNHQGINPGNALIYSLKKDNREDVLKVCADKLELAIRNSVKSPEDVVFTNIPRRKSAIIEYGIDHSGLLANELALRFGTEYIKLLESNAKIEQKSLDHSERLKNADFDIVKDIDLSGREVIIVDDIITSGASMASAAALIRSLGCKNITAAVLAVAYKDS